MSQRSAVVYWDASAIISALLRDKFSDLASQHIRSASLHLVASLAWSESHAVIARFERDGTVSGLLIDKARDVLANGPWQRVNAGPNWKMMPVLARTWSLRGADLWHLATAKQLQADLAELTLLTFDLRLNTAAIGEGLAR